MLGSMMISFVYLVGCTKDPDNNTNINPPAVKEDLSLNSYVAYNGDTFRGAYNSQITDSVYLFEQKKELKDCYFNYYPGYSYIKYLQIKWSGSNKDGSRPKDTVIILTLVNYATDTVKLKAEDINMFFEGASMYGNVFFEGENRLSFETVLNIQKTIDEVSLRSNWGWRSDGRIYNDSFSSGTYPLKPSWYPPQFTTSFKMKKLIDGKNHRVFESEYYGGYVNNIPRLVKMRMVLD